MKSTIKERAAKAALLGSLAKSQLALAKILDSIADVASGSPETAKLLRDNVRSLTLLQQTMAEAVTRVEWEKRWSRDRRPDRLWSYPDKHRGKLKFGRLKRKAGQIRAKK